MNFLTNYCLKKEWKNQLPGKTFFITCSFTSTEWITKDLVNNGVKTDMGLKMSYYLSDEIIDQFQQDCVGKNKDGKYMIVLVKPKIGEERVEVYEILGLTKTTLKTKHLRSGSILEYTSK